jgi:hypothetical protein
VIRGTLARRLGGTRLRDPYYILHIAADEVWIFKIMGLIFEISFKIDRGILIGQKRTY